MARGVVGAITNSAIVISIINFLVDSMPRNQRPEGTEDHSSGAFVLEA
eukprot:gene4963-23012_t